MMVKRILCALLCCVMLGTCLPVAAYAEETVPEISAASQQIGGQAGEIAPLYVYTSTLTAGLSISGGTATVSYTHLDVYKRQAFCRAVAQKPEGRRRYPCRSICAKKRFG